ncbi:MmcB family DNA repair protein [Rhizobium sp. TRM95111]|uniref:MmcB family DNA repair protein n=1 Tax=Rhizobium alarense TaxID=2846851 RepID=UPI001F1EA4FF|nr:MmcB family DNA repair protein [Rhizobium alarense]MCF3642319.1 MmcB family DNA repair protein [Rhizobium alarense]
MTIVSLHNDNPLIDGRQSARAMMVRRGVQMLLSEMRHAVLPELTLASGRRADLITLSEKGEIWIVEIKTSIEDFRVDRKWPDYRRHCDRLFFATHKDVPLDIFPEECGLILSDGYGAHILREAPEHRLPAPTRKSVTFAFARVAAGRLLLAEFSTDRRDGPPEIEAIVSGAADGEMG